MIQPQKKCSRCHVVKSKHHFYKHKDKLYSQCVSCTREAQKAYYTRKTLPEDQINWTPLQNIHPERKAGTWSCFTKDEAETIKRFLLDNPMVPLLAVARYFQVNPKTIYNCINQNIPFERRGKNPDKL